MNCQIGKIEFNKFDFDTALRHVSTLIENGNHCHQIIIANVVSLAIAEKNDRFAKVCKKADFVFADGMPIIWASRLLGNALPERLAGPDFMWKFSSLCAKRGYRVFLLGGRADSLEMLQKNLQTGLPGINIVGTYSPPFGIWPEAENQKMIEMINSSNADILWLGVSTPKQDFWIEEHKQALKVKVAVGVGAAFDFHSGRVQRAPIWMQRNGLEWLHRFLQEPRRLFWKYTSTNSLFCFIFIKELLNKAKKILITAKRKIHQ